MADKINPHDAETHAYQCRPDIPPDQAARFVQLWEPVNDEEGAHFDAGLARFCAWAVIALAAVGGWLIGGML